MEQQKKEILLFKGFGNSAKFLGYLLGAVLILNLLVLIFNALFYMLGFGVN
ncbi:hypothetical protein BH10BAC4_BH10BAC4_25400 [soil metagenome]